MSHRRRRRLAVLLLAVVAAVGVERLSVWMPALHPYRRVIVERGELTLLALERPPAIAPEAWPPTPTVIAHGGGAAYGAVVTNSLEALDLSFAEGLRFIEVDIHWTSDRHLVLIHDWDTTRERLFGAPGGAMDLATFRAASMRGGLTQLDVGALSRWVARHPGVWIVSDVKTNNLRALRIIATDHPRLAGRLIPQAYRFSELDDARNLGFGPVILTLYRKNYTLKALTELLERRTVYAVTLPTRLSRYLPRLAELDVPVYVHTVNDPSVALRLRSMGARGVYSDLLGPNGRLPSAHRKETSVRTGG